MEEQTDNGLDLLVGKIQSASHALQENARSVISRSVTARAWLTGYYIVEYEQKGNGRAQYGERLITVLAKKLNDKSFGTTNLKLFRSFYLNCPFLAHPVSDYLVMRYGKSQTLSDFFPKMLSEAKGRTASDLLQSSAPHGDVSCDGYAMRLSDGNIIPTPQAFFDCLPFSHISLLLRRDNPLERTFYAVEAMRGVWSYRQLKRQIDTNYFERSGWSKKPELLADKLAGSAEQSTFRNELKSPFTFEFLGLAAKDAIEETVLEQSIIDHLQDFVMELGMGFCLEARQKKLLIDDRYYKADLVFYHRILKCHCIIELKAHRLDYADMAQLNMYIEYYRQHYMLPDDNPPVGLLLCTEYGQEMVEYLAPSVNPQLFVAKYLLQLPDKEKIKDFLMRENGR